MFVCQAPIYRPTPPRRPPNPPTPPRLPLHSSFTGQGRRDAHQTTQARPDSLFTVPSQANVAEAPTKPPKPAPTPSSQFLPSPTSPRRSPATPGPPQLPSSQSPFLEALGSQCRRRRLPAQPMPLDAVLPLEAHDHHRGRGCRDRVSERRLEARAIGHRTVDQPVESCDLCKIKPQRCREQLLEKILVLSLRQEVEHASAVVIADHDRGPNAVSPQSPQTVHVVVQRQVPKQQHRRRVHLTG